MKTLYILAFICFSFVSKSQSNLTSDSTNRTVNLLHQLEGTYQLQIINSRELPTISSDMLDKIQAKRHQTDTIYFSVKHNFKVMILPYSTIEKKDFTAIKRVAYFSN